MHFKCIADHTDEMSASRTRLWVDAERVEVERRDNSGLVIERDDDVGLSAIAMCGR